MITSVFVKVKIDVDPKSVVHTSPDKFDFGEKIFINKYPKAKDVVEIRAKLVSPFIFEFFLPHNKRIAKRIVTGKTKYVGVVIFKIEASANAPNAAWLSPSPINENLFKTNVTPKSDEHRAITVPVMTA